MGVAVRNTDGQHWKRQVTEADGPHLQVDSMSRGAETVTSNPPPQPRHCWTDDLVARTSTLGRVFVCTPGLVGHTGKTIRHDRAHVLGILSRQTILQLAPIANHQPVGATKREQRRAGWSKRDGSREQCGQSTWMGEVKLLPKVCYKWQQHTNGEAVRRSVTQQNAHRDRDDVFGGTRHMQRRVRCWHCQPDRKPSSIGTLDSLTLQQLSAWRGNLVEERAVRNTQSIETLGTITLASPAKPLPGTLHHAGHAATTACHGDEFMVA